MNEAKRAITVANDATLSELIRSATDRVVVMAPALSNTVAKAICEKWPRLGGEAVTIIVDVNPEVYRLGFGDFEALDLLEETAAGLGTTLNRHDGIRIGLLIVDDTTVVYSPTPQLIEAGPKKPTTPNAIVIGHPPESIARELGQGPNGLRDQTVGLDKAEKAKIADVKLDLERNPPQKFDIARTIRVFNTHFEFVEFNLKHTALHKARITLPKEVTYLTGDNQLDAMMQHSIELVQGDLSADAKYLEKLRAKIAQRYLITLPGYGAVVLRKVKDDFERQVERVRRCVERFSQRANDQIVKVAEHTRARLVERILPQITANPPQHWRKHLGSPPLEQDMRAMLDAELRDVFDKKLALTQKMQVKCLFKGVTYEMLNEPKFIALARKKLPGLNEMYSEFEVAKTVE